MLQFIIEVDPDLTNQNDKHFHTDFTLLYNDLTFVVYSLVKLIANILKYSSVVVTKEGHIGFKILSEEELFIFRSVMNFSFEDFLHGILACLQEVCIFEPSRMFFIALLFLFINLFHPFIEICFT